MCLSTVYANSSDSENVILEYVSKIEVAGDQITLTDVMGETKTIEGSIAMADLTGGKVLVNCA